MIIGLGSLYLTWQSTRAAKKAIDISIEIYENQKIDDETKKEKENHLKLSAIKTIIREEIKDNYFLFIKVYKILEDIINNPDIKVMATLVNDAYLIEQSDGFTALFKGQKYDNVQHYLFDTLILDRDISKAMIGLKVSSMLYQTISTSFVSFILDNNTEYAKKLICEYFKSISQYKYEMELLYKLCSDEDTKPISEYLSHL